MLQKYSDGSESGCCVAEVQRRFCRDLDFNKRLRAATFTHMPGIPKRGTYANDKDLTQDGCSIFAIVKQSVIKSRH